MSLQNIGLYPKKEYDYDTNGNLIYEGFTNASASVNDPEWLILKHFYDSNNNRIATRVADNHIKYNKIWTNRNSYNYTTSDNQPPVIDSITWNDNTHYENHSYILTINAHDPEETTIHNYNVSCDDTNVTVTQDVTNPNIFTVTYPEYTNDVTVTYTITVTDNHELTTTETLSQLVHNINHPPIIDSVTWDDNDHYESGSYTLTIAAHDPDSGDSIDDYTVTCNDPNVIITQNNYNLNVFYISYPHYNSDTVVTYTVTVTDTFGDNTFTIFSKLIHHVLTSGDRGVFAGGYDEPADLYGNIDYIDISILGNAQYFGDLTLKRQSLGATSNGTNNRGVFAGGWNGKYLYTIDSISLSSLGNAKDFGKLSVEKNLIGTTSNGTNNRGVFIGGRNSKEIINIIDYITISEPCNAIDFGDLIIPKANLAATSNGTNDRAIFAGGWNTENRFNNIEFINIKTLGNSREFGRLHMEGESASATSNGIKDRAIFAGEFIYRFNRAFNTIDYVTISTLGDALDFGDLTVIRLGLGATSNGTNDRGVFAGGRGSDFFDTIDYITISILGDAQDFGNLSYKITSLAATSNG